MANNPEMLVVIPEQDNSIQKLSEDDTYRLAVAAMLNTDPDSEKVDSLCKYSDSKIRKTTQTFQKWSLGPSTPDLLSYFDKEGNLETRQKLASEKKFVVALTKALLSNTKYQPTGLPDIATWTRDDRRLNDLQVTHGRFESRIVYRNHPARQNYYIPFATFHDHLIDEKSAELVRIAAALGAKRINLVETESRSTAAEASVGVSPPAGGGDLGAKGGMNQRNSSQFEINYRAGEPPIKKPRVPDNLYWFHAEPQWQTMAEARLNNWTTEYAVRFRYTTDFNVNARVAGMLQGVGFNLGGSFEEARRVEQEYSVQFWPRSSYEN